MPEMHLLVRQLHAGYSKLNVNRAVLEFVKNEPTPGRPFTVGSDDDITMKSLAKTVRDTVNPQMTSSLCFRQNADKKKDLGLLSRNFSISIKVTAENVTPLSKYFP